MYFKLLYTHLVFVSFLHELTTSLWAVRLGFNPSCGILKWITGIQSLWSAGGMWCSCWWFLCDSRIHWRSFLCVCLHTFTHYSFFLNLKLQVKPRFAMSSDFQYVWHQSCVLLATPKCSSVQFLVCISLTDQCWVVYDCLASGATLCPSLTILCLQFSVNHPVSPLLNSLDIQVCISLR